MRNTYQTLNPDIILVNSHGETNPRNIHIKWYTASLKNTFQEMHDGSAVLIKTNSKLKMKDEFLTDVTEIKLETLMGTTSIAATYLPPRRPYLPFPDFHQLLYNNHTTYIIGDFNAKHSYFGNI